MELFSAMNISKQFSGHKALDQVNIAIPEGSIYGLLGPNGAGKQHLSGLSTRSSPPMKVNSFLREGNFSQMTSITSVIFLKNGDYIKK